MCTIIAKKWSINWRNPIQNTFTVTFARQNATEMRVSHSNHIGCDPMLADMRTRIETRIDLSE